MKNWDAQTQWETHLKTYYADFSREDFTSTGFYDLLKQGIISRITGSNAFKNAISQSVNYDEEWLKFDEVEWKLNNS